MQTLKCSSCNQEKTIENFHQKTTARGYDYNCKECKRNRYISSRALNSNLYKCQNCQEYRSIKVGDTCITCLRILGKKICPKCLIEKPLNEYYKAAKNNSHCKECLANNRSVNRCKICRSTRLTQGGDCRDCLRKNNKAWCKHCNIIMDISEFYSRNSQSCKDCCIYINSLRGANLTKSKTSAHYKYDRKSRLKHKYNISELDYLNLVAKQNGVCKICSKMPSSPYPRLYIDHDHLSGKIRGLLCHTCNSGLGMFKDSKDLLLKSIQYLDQAALASELESASNLGTDCLIASGVGSCNLMGPSLPLINE